MMHEICSEFENAGFSLNHRLVDMFDEHFSHRTERRGCGFTQATRFLAERINQPRLGESADDLAILEDIPTREVERLAVHAQSLGWTHGWRSLHEAPAEVCEALSRHRCSERVVGLGLALSVIESTLQLEESRLLFQVLRDILSAGSVDARLPDIPSMPKKPTIGSCSAAEEYYLEIAHGRVRRGGEANILISDDGRPVLVEKIGLGESHSAISVCPTVMNGIRLPAGSLFALERTQPETPTRTPNGIRLPWSVIIEARFLRFTTLAVAPTHRQRAFSRQLEAQLTADMFSPLTTTIEQLHQFAMGELSA